MRRARAVTIIELLIVVAILAILVALLTTGLRGIANTSRGRATKALLGNARGMLGEFAARSPLPAQSWTSGTVASPGDVNTGESGRTGAAVQTTQNVMAILSAIPVNGDALRRVPQEQTMRVGSGEVPILLDGWKNPILFVPAGGLSGVTVNGTAKTIVSPDGRPFFASAGADGNFSTGDDNQYSYED